jgi:hypothetical protein
MEPLGQMELAKMRPLSGEGNSLFFVDRLVMDLLIASVWHVFCGLLYLCVHIMRSGLTELSRGIIRPPTSEKTADILLEVLLN